MAPPSPGGRMNSGWMSGPVSSGTTMPFDLSGFASALPAATNALGQLGRGISNSVALESLLRNMQTGPLPWEGDLQGTVGLLGSEIERLQSAVLPQNIMQQLQQQARAAAAARGLEGPVSAGIEQESLGRATQQFDQARLGQLAGLLSQRSGLIQQLQAAEAQRRQQAAQMDAARVQAGGELGGGIGSTLGTALGALAFLIPGVGPILAPILMAMGGQLGNTAGNAIGSSTVLPTGQARVGYGSPSGYVPR